MLLERKVNAPPNKCRTNFGELGSRFEVRPRGDYQSSDI